MIDEKKVYNYIKGQINPYGKPFDGTAYEFGLKIMNYIENMGKVDCAECEAIMNLKAAIYDEKKKTEWIPCSERLPDLHRVDMESEGEYFMISDSVIITDGENIGITKYEVDDDDIKGWLACECEEIGDVIAWQPLPEPFKLSKE